MEQPSKTNRGERGPGLEVERKYLLASEGDARRLEEKIKQVFPEASLIGGYSETSYYFPKIDKNKTKKLISMIFSKQEEAADLLAKIEKIPDDLPVAVRFRRRKNLEDKSFILTIKAGSDPLHDIERIEIETSDISENFLEGFAANGIEPESIWHSNRREYKIDDNTKVDVQDVSGYGWTAEVESSDLNKVQEVSHRLGLEPLTPTILGKMYNRYKENWKDYYEGEGEARHFNSEDWAQIESASKEKATRNEVSL